MCNVIFRIGYCAIEYRVCDDEADAFSISQPDPILGAISGVDTICDQDYIVIEGKLAALLINDILDNVQF